MFKFKCYELLPFSVRLLDWDSLTSSIYRGGVSRLIALRFRKREFLEILTVFYDRALFGSFAQFGFSSFPKKFSGLADILNLLLLIEADDACLTNSKTLSSYSSLSSRAADASLERKDFDMLACFL